MKWLHSDGSVVDAITRLRHILTNGSLLLLPFRAEEYRQDVHATVYKCQAVNSIGILVSRDIRIRAVVVQDYEVQVYDEFVIAGNTAIMKCQIPSFVADYVSVESWLRDSSFIIYPSYDNDGKYFVLPTGELQIQEVRASDGLFTYRCRTVHQLTGDTRLSATSGRLFVTEPHGTVPPRIAESKVSVTVKEGEIAVLPCSAQAFPIPTYGWFQRSDDGRTVPLSFGLGKMMLIGGNLIIKNAEINDRGVFVCIVQNPVGNERVEVYLGITATLTAVIRPSKLQLDMCQEAVFQCLVTGFPITSQIWLKDGQPLSSDTEATVSQDILRITCVTKKHRGIYQCIVNNDVDCVQASAELLLGDIPPSITHIFSEETIYPNRQMSLQCIATGSPPPQLNWMVDDVPVPKLPKFRTSSFSTEDGNVISYLNISQAQTKDGGRYSCIAANKAGKAEKSNRVNVFGLPFIRQMTRKSVVAGDTIIIHCPFGGYPIENILWEKGGLRLPLNHLQVVFPNGTLKLQSVQRTEDAGAYTCIIHNKEGQTARQDLELMVMVPPKINPSSFQDTRLHEGSHARIICAVVEGDLPIAFTWLKERRAIPSELGIAIRDFDEFSSVLTISKASTEHGGNYTCVARNAAASDSYTALITVNVPPRWIVQPQDVTTFPGLKIVINCQATGSPLPTIKWLKAVDGSPGEYEELRGNDLSLHSLENGSLVLESAKEEHDGRYLCRASNGVGNGLSKVVNVDVRVPVRFDIKFANVTIRKDEDAKLICSVKGDRPIRISWSRHQQRLNPSSDPRLNIQETQRDGKIISELTIRKVQREDSATFFCLAQNTFGKDESQIKLIVIEPPEPPKDLLLVDHSSRSVTISWNFPFDGNTPISHFVVQLKKNLDPWQRSQNTTVSSKELTASIEDLFPSITYQCRVFAINTVGFSNPSESLTFTTLEEAPGGPPLFVQAEVKENELVKVTWKAPKKELWNGNIRGYYVGYKVHDSSEPYSFVTVDVADASNNDLVVNLQSLRPFTKYSIIVQAFNHIGTSPRSQEINVLTSEDAPSLPPMNVQCAPFLRDSLQVSWDPPPESSFNGILQGYKVISTPDDEWYDANPLETKVTTGSNTIVSSLLKFTNYSIQVVAFTRVGDGPKSDAVYCNTNEDVPEAPSDIKVISTSADSVLIAWKPPIRPNGIIKRYTLYKRGLEKDKEDIVKHVLPSTDTTFEAKSLVKNRRYEFWVTASTTIGEGQSTPVVSMTKSEPIVPAKLVSFGGVINVPWKSSLELPCKAIGIPPPETQWKFHHYDVLDKGGYPPKLVELGKSLVNTDVVFIQTDGTLRFKEIHTNNSGNYTCHVVNTHGSDQIAYFLKIQVPPVAPKLIAASSTSTSIELHWNHRKDSKIPLQGYYLYYKREFGEWSEVSLGPDFDRYVLINLECGTRYQMYIAAVNRLGIGEPSEIITAKTTGEAPIKPKKNIFLREDITFVTLLLEAWASGGCPILYFVVQYKRSSQNDWRLVSNNVLLQQREFIILDLIPATWYAVRVTAHNNAGSTIAEYEFATRTTFGGTISPLGSSERNTIKTPLYSDSRFLASILICTFAVIIFIVIICICSKKRRQFRQHKTACNLSKKERKKATDNLTTYTSAQISNCENKELMTYKQKCVPQVYPQIGIRADFGERTLPGRRHNVHQLQQYPRENYICASDYTTPIPETDILNLNPTQHNLSQPWLIRPSELIAYDQNVPDLLEHGPESCPSNESSPDLHSLESQLRKVKRIQASAREEPEDLYYPGLRTDPGSNETTFIFSHDESKDAGYEEEEISDAECDIPSFKSDLIKYEPAVNPRTNPSPQRFP